MPPGSARPGQSRSATSKPRRAGHLPRAKRVVDDPDSAGASGVLLGLTFAIPSRKRARDRRGIQALTPPRTLRLNEALPLPNLRRIATQVAVKARAGRGAQHRGFSCPVICDFAFSLFFSQVFRQHQHRRIPLTRGSTLLPPNPLRPLPAKPLRRLPLRRSACGNPASRQPMASTGSIGTMATANAGFKPPRGR